MSISEIDRLRAQVAYLEAQAKHMNRPRDGAEIARMDAAKARADGVLANFGETASPPNLGEAEVDYWRRLLRQIGSKTQQFAVSRFDGVDMPALGALEPLVMSAASDAIRNDANSKPGVLIPMQHTDPSGRTITTYAGDIGAFMAPFMAQGVTGTINRNPNGNQ
jgi:hypothetical protein